MRANIVLLVIVEGYSLSSRLSSVLFCDQTAQIRNEFMKLLLKQKAVNHWPADIL